MKIMWTIFNLLFALAAITTNGVVTAQRGTGTRPATDSLRQVDNSQQLRRSLFLGGPPKSDWSRQGLDQQYGENRWNINGLEGPYRKSPVANNEGSVSTHRTYAGSVDRSSTNDDDVSSYDDDDYKRSKKRPGNKDYEYVEPVDSADGKGYNYYDDDYYFAKGDNKNAKQAKKRAHEAIKKAKKEKKEKEMKDGGKGKGKGGSNDEDNCYYYDDDCMTIGKCHVISLFAFTEL
jgi:hypothetical protein